MTKTYIGAKVVTAWPEERDGKSGYGVKYADGYMSWSPAATFEEAYREASCLSFGLAIEATKKGYRVARLAWHPGSFVYYVPAASYPAQTGVAKAHFGENALVPYKAYLAVKQGDEQVCVFVPGMDSILADDWTILE